MTPQTPLDHDISTQSNYDTFKTNSWKKMADNCGPKWYKHSHVIALLVLVQVLWAIGYSVFGKDAVGIQSQLFSLVVLFITAKIAGVLVSYVRIPPMVGMLLMGVLLRNVHFIHLSGPYVKLAAILRQLALVNILLPAGLGLDPGVLSRMKWMILNLSFVPPTAEVVALAVGSHLALGFPWLWGLLLGLLLAAVSPAVIIPCLFELQERGLGVNKGVHTMVIAASTFNDIICIALFGVVIGVIFSTGSLTMQILQGPIIIGIGFAFGIFWGLVCIWVPSKMEQHLTTLRTLLLGFGCVLAALGSDAIGYGGAGALACIIAAFVASYGWRKQGWSSKNPVRTNFVLLWKFFEPISFSLIGMEVNFEILELNTVLWGTLVMLIALLLRMIVSFASTQCSNFNVKEHIFVAISWIPKATVQAALGPIALDIARNLNDSEAKSYANEVVIIAVVSIILTSPIGAILIMELGPKLLHLTPPDEKNTKQDTEGVDNPEFEDTEQSERL